MAVGNGYYSTSTSAARVACTTGITNSTYSSDGNGQNACSWSCSSGFNLFEGSCISDADYELREVSGNITVTYRDYSGSNEYCRFEITSDVLNVSNRATKSINHLNTDAKCQEYILTELASDFPGYVFSSPQIAWSSNFLKNDKKSSVRVPGTIRVKKRPANTWNQPIVVPGGGGGGGIFEDFNTQHR